MSSETWRTSLLSRVPESRPRLLPAHLLIVQRAEMWKENADAEVTVNLKVPCLLGPASRFLPPRGAGFAVSGLRFSVEVDAHVFYWTPGGMQQATASRSLQVMSRIGYVKVTEVEQLLVEAHRRGAQAENERIRTGLRPLGLVV